MSATPGRQPAKKARRRKTGKKRTQRPDPERVAAILAALDGAWPAADCSLRHRSAFQLLVATILSAQCTDARVNLVTRELFKVAGTPAKLAALPREKVEELIRSTGFFRNKARSIQETSKLLTEQHKGRVPPEMNALLALPGVARKTANVVLGTAFGRAEGVVVDTHVMRIANLLGLTTNKDPVKIERDLMEILPREHWIRFTHQVIEHGRAVCIARRPRCGECRLAAWCPSAS